MAEGGSPISQIGEEFGPTASGSTDQPLPSQRTGRSVLSEDEMKGWSELDDPLTGEDPDKGQSRRKLTLQAGDYRFSKIFNSSNDEQRVDLTLTGLAAFPVSEIDAVQDYWSDKSQNHSTNNSSYLRSLATAFFYQANISQAYSLLRRLGSEACGEHEDLGIILMKAECEIVFQEEELKSFEKFKESIKKATLTEKDVEKWNSQLQKRDRFLGCMLLQVAAFYKFNQQKLEEPLLEPLLDLLLSRFDIIISLLPEMVKLLYLSLDKVMIGIFRDMYMVIPGIFDGFPQKNYIRSLVYNGLAFLAAHANMYESSFNSARFGLIAMECSSYHNELTKTVLYGNLQEHAAVGCAHINKKERGDKHRKMADKAYETTEDPVSTALKFKMRLRLRMRYEEGELRCRLSKNEQQQTADRELRTEL